MKNAMTLNGLDPKEQGRLIQWARAQGPKPQGPPNSPCVSFHLVK